MVYRHIVDKNCAITPSFSESDVSKGDFRVLCSSIEKKREDVRLARLALGIDLHQLGEHHVRKKEYNEAMSVFSEALVEKRAAAIVNCDTDREEKTMSSSSSLMSSADWLEQRNDSEQKTINEIIVTLSAMGTVHSLIGDHTEAMKCYSEITSIRSIRSFSSFPRLNTNQPCNENDEMESSELHEEISELDDLFRSISFRNGRNTKEKKMSFVKSSENIEVIREEIEIRQDETYCQWEQLNDSMKDLETLFTTCKQIGCPIDDNDFLYISNQVAVLKEDHQHRIENDGHNESMREKCLYMCLLVRDKILSIQKQIAVFRSSKKDTISTVESYEGNEYVEASMNVAATMILIGGIHYKLSNFNEELHMYNEALLTYQEAFGECHPYVAGTRKNIGMVLAERFDFDGAMEQFECAKDIYSQHNGGSISSDIASAISCMGNVQYRRGDLDNALSLYSKALCMYRTLGEEGVWSKENVINVTSTLKIIGMVYTKRSDWETAMKCYEEAMELLLSVNMEKTVEAASLFSRMGGLFYRDSKYDKAMAHYQNAYKVAKAALGTKNHPDVASILHFIGIVYQKQKRLRDAMACYQECIQIYRSTLGPDNPAKASTTVYIGSLHFHQKRYDEAMACYKEALRLYETSYGQNHPQVAPTMKSIAMIHIKKEEYDEAMDIFQDLLRRKCIILGSYHPDIAYAHKCIGNIHIRRGETGKALRQYKHAFEIYQKSLGENHKETKSIKNSIASIRHNLMMQQNVHRRDNNKGLIDRRAYKRRQLSASRYAY